MIVIVFYHFVRLVFIVVRIIKIIPLNSLTAHANKNGFISMLKIRLFMFHQIIFRLNGNTNCSLTYDCQLRHYRLYTSFQNKIKHKTKNLQ
jgi:hypothetical protein